MAPKDATDETSTDGSSNFHTEKKEETTEQTTSQRQSKAPVDRRSLLKMTGIAACAAAPIGFGRVASAKETQHGITFDKVVNAVDDLGMDAGGNDAIDAALDDAIASGTLIKFPPGEYLVTETHRVSVSNFGIQGTGQSRRDVQFLPEPGTGSTFIAARGRGPVMLENFSLNERMDETSALALNVSSQRGDYVGNIEWLGQTGLDNNYPQAFMFATQPGNRDAVTVVEDVAVGLDAPAIKADYPEGQAFLTGYGGLKGEVVIRNAKIHERNSAATRYTNISGAVTFENCEFVNNQNANLRFAAGEHPTKKSSATDCYVEMDGSRSGADAVRIESSGDVESGAVIDGLEVIWTKETANGVIAVPSYQDHGSFTVRNSVIRNEGSRSPTISAPTDSSGDNAVVVENCSFTGAGGRFDAGGRDGSIIRDSCIDMPNAEITGGFSTENISNSECPRPGEPNDEDDGDNSTDTSPENTLTIRGTGTATNYRFAVSGKLTELDDSVESYETLGESTFEGWVTSKSNVDKFGYSGEINQFEIISGGPLDITRNGESVTAEELGTGNKQPTASIEVASKSGLNVEFSGAESTDPDGDLAAYRWDIDGTSYSGETVSETFPDAGTYPVSLTVEDADGSTATTSTQVTVYYGNELEIRGTGVTTEYNFKVGGSVSPVSDTIEPWDSVTDTGATGWVTETSHSDTYTFDGDITTFDFLEGEAAVFVNGEEINPATIGLPNKLVVDGRRSSSETKYSITVSGELASDPILAATESDDVLSGGTVDGVVSDDADGYRFSGELTSLSVNGDAAVSIEHTDG